MSTSDALSIAHSADEQGRVPIRPAVRIYIVLRLFFSILLELWAMNLRVRVQGMEAVRPQLDPLFRRQARRFRRTAEMMGGLLVKVGQFLSSRVDVLPQPYIQELQALQDNVRPDPWPTVEAVLMREIPDKDVRFRSFDPEPLASASLGQVYRAETAHGDPVAVKIQRPNIRTIVAADLRALRMVVGLTRRLTTFGRTFDLGALFDEFRRTIYEELDYVHEAANAARIAQDCRDLPWLKVPMVHSDLSTRQVLTMELCSGVKISDLEGLERAGISRTQVAERVIHLYLHMVMNTGFFHADPHAGNILVQPGGRIVLLDYGMTGQITPALRRQIRRLFVGVSERRPTVIVDSLVALGIVRPEADLRALKARAAYLLERYYAETLTDVRQLDIDSLLHDLEQLVREEPIQFPAAFAFLGRAIGMLVGLAESLDPSVNLIDLFRPYASRFVTDEAGGPIGYLERRVQDWLGATVALPPAALRVLRRIDDGDLETGIRWEVGQQHLRRIDRRLAELTAAFYVTGFTVLGVWLLTLGWRESADFAFAFAAAQLLWRWWRSRGSR
jgi:predicted unusual protein kinase regulating ubiquinone biosynthesis (AarF/ABC1/UbiB family)